MDKVHLYLWKGVGYEKAQESIKPNNNRPHTVEGHQSLASQTLERRREGDKNQG